MFWDRFWPHKRRKKGYRKWSNDYKPLNEYAIIGNMDSCALVALDGSIDWCCLPHLDSPSIFGALLDKDKGGFFSISPTVEFKSIQRYIEGTNILETVFETPQGKASLVDYMPIDVERPFHISTQIHRLMRGIAGRVDMEIKFDPRFNYGQQPATIERISGGLTAHSSQDVLTLATDLPFVINEVGASSHFKTARGKEEILVLSYGNKSSETLMREAASGLKATEKFWKDWVHHCEGDCIFEGPWHEEAVRSGLILKLLTHEDTGSIVAAATTSLPEELGGIRNWDYRYTWIRDASFTVQALYNLGHMEEARRFLEWLNQIYVRYNNPSLIKIMYSLHGEEIIDEKELTHLEGYCGSSPVRIGNKAFKQRQLDIYGELLEAAFQLSRYQGKLDEKLWPFLRDIVDYVCEVWRDADSGIWGIRGKPRHYVYSKVMCWVALDRGIRIARTLNWPGDIRHWQFTAEKIKQAVLEQGFNKDKNSFVQSFDSETLDASNLLLPFLGFLDFQDPRAQGTIDATLKELTQGPFVYRYRGENGLPGEEGAFALCSFWLIEALILSGRLGRPGKSSWK